MNLRIPQTGSKTPNDYVKPEDNLDGIYDDLTAGLIVTQRELEMGNKVIQRNVNPDDFVLSGVREEDLKRLAEFDVERSFGWGLIDERIHPEIVKKVLELNPLWLQDYYVISQKSVCYRESKAKVCEAFAKTAGWLIPETGDELFKDEDGLSTYEEGSCIIAKVLATIKEGNINDLTFEFITQDQFKNKIEDFGVGDWALCQLIIDTLVTHNDSKVSSFIFSIVDGIMARKKQEGQLTEEAVYLGSDDYQRLWKDYKEAHEAEKKRIEEEKNARKTKNQPQNIAPAVPDTASAQPILTSETKKENEPQGSGLSLCLMIILIAIICETFYRYS